LESFVTPFLSHLHKRAQQQNARDYIKGLLSDRGVVSECVEYS